jgi:AcrR family transcriptional regulator
MNRRSGSKPLRPYRQVARAKAAAETGRRIIDAFAASAGDRWFDEITLQEVATRAGVTVQSVIRRFGSKEGLIKAMIGEFGPAIGAEFSSTPGDIDSAVSRLFTAYERFGDGTVRNLAQEQRVPALQPLIDFGRKEHRRITAAQFAPWLEKLAGAERRDAVDALVIATDIYTWKLLRRDMERSLADSKRAVKRLIAAVLAAYAADTP